MYHVRVEPLFHLGVVLLVSVDPDNLEDIVIGPTDEQLHVGLELVDREVQLDRTLVGADLDCHGLRVVSDVHVVDQPDSPPLDHEVLRHLLVTHLGLRVDWPVGKPVLWVVQHEQTQFVSLQVYRGELVVELLEHAESLGFGRHHFYFDKKAPTARHETPRRLVIPRSLFCRFPSVVVPTRQANASEDPEQTTRADRQTNNLNSS